MPTEQQSISRRDADGAGATGEFNLVRYFSLVCVGVFVVVAGLMCLAFYQISKHYIKHDAEQRAVLIAERLAPLAFADEQPLPSPGTPEYALVDRELRDVLRPLLIFKIKIYDADGKIVYTTDSRIRVGRLDRENDKLEKSLAGGIVSELQTDSSVWDLDEEDRIKGVVIETYVPVFATAPTGMVQGVLEIYQDVSATYARLPGVIALIVGASVVAMGMLFGILYWVVRKADWIIHQQTQTIRQAKADLEGYASELEQRVEKRTGELREAQAQQIHDEKMVGMGTLAAGVAHELNTPLGTILGSAQLVLDHCARSIGDGAGVDQTTNKEAACEHCLEDLKRIESQARRCKATISNLVDFSRKSADERTWENLGELVEGTISLVKPEASAYGIRVEQTLGGDLPTVRINANEIQQVLVNILKNGIAAMPGGGTLGVRFSRRDQMATIEIRDTGTGIEQANLPRIFEPFFTTKEVGKGTGLGLSISYRIVKDHGGNITVSSTVGEGSTFVIELPVDAADVESGHGKVHQLLNASDPGQEVKAQDE